MLTFEENIWNFKYIEFCSTLNLLPVEINVITGKIKKQSGKWRLMLWKIQYFLSISHWLYTLGRLIQSLHSPQELKGDHFVANFIYTLGIGFIWLLSFCLFWRQLSEVIIIFNELYTKSKDNTPEEPENGENKGQLQGFYSKHLSTHVDHQQKRKSVPFNSPFKQMNMH